MWGAVSKGQPCLRAAGAVAAASQSYPSALLWGLILERSAEPARREEAGRGLCRPALSLKAEHWRPLACTPFPLVHVAALPRARRRPEAPAASRASPHPASRRPVRQV